MRNIVLVLAACLTSVVSWAEITGVVTTENNEAHKGVIRWVNKDKAYAIVSKSGVEIQVKAVDCRDLVIDKPQGFDAAVESIQKGQNAAAIPVLKKIMGEYRHLQWDRLAGAQLVQAYLADKKADDAIKTCREIISVEPEAGYKGSLAPAYWQALMMQGSEESMRRLDTAVMKAAKSGDRFSSGAALLLRGDLILRAGKPGSADVARKALVDAYLRVVLMYEDQSALRPEALYKAAQCFEVLSQGGRAESMRSELKKNFASSPWAAK